MGKIKKPTKKQISDFIKDKFPSIEFDGIKFEKCILDSCHFKVISYGRMIGQSEEPLNEKYWDRVYIQLKWTWSL